MKKFIRFLPAALFCIGLVQMIGSCSVKEDRSQCLCRFVLELRELRARDEPVELRVDAAGEVCFDERLLHPGGQIELYVPREMLTVSALCGATRDGLHIQYGQACPELYLHYSTLVASGESCAETIRLHKCFCRIRLKLTGSASGGNGLCVALSGNVDGYNEDGTVSSGPFLAYGTFSEEGDCTVAVPRQEDDSLMLEMTDGSSCLRSFPLGKYLQDSSFDWRAEDLDDVDVTIDYASSELTLDSRLWVNPKQFEIDF